MTKRQENRIQNKRTLVRVAKLASANAQRISRAMNIPYEIIRGDEVYSVSNKGLVQIATLKRNKSASLGITKGTKICLK